jgi:hypothetical protein
LPVVAGSTGQGARSPGAARAACAPSPSAARPVRQRSPPQCARGGCPARRGPGAAWRRREGACGERGEHALGLEGEELDIGGLGGAEDGVDDGGGRGGEGGEGEGALGEGGVVRLRGHEVRVGEEAVYRVDDGEAGGGVEGDGGGGGDEGEGGCWRGLQLGGVTEKLGGVTKLNGVTTFLTLLSF